MKKMIIGLLTLTTFSSFASTDLRGSIEAQASAVFATADSKASTGQAVCFEFGKLLGLGMAYKVVQPSAALEKYINETVSLYGENCKSKKISKRERSEIAEHAKTIFLEIRD